MNPFHLSRVWLILFYGSLVASALLTAASIFRPRPLVIAGLILTLLAAMASTEILFADPFCWGGYIAYDGSCAWE